MDGQQRKDAGTAQVLDNTHEWWKRIVEEIAKDLLYRYGQLTCSHLRENCEIQGVGGPPHPNAWGAMILSLSKRKIIKKSGHYVPSRHPKSHAAIEAVWTPYTT